MENILLLAPFILIVLIMNGLYALFPYISRKTLSFGIAIPEEAFCIPEVKRIRDEFRNFIFVGSIPFLAVICFITPNLINDDKLLSIFITAIILLNLLFNGLLYYYYNTKMKKIKNEKGWAQATPQLIAIETGFRSKNSLVSPWWFSLYLLILAGTIITSVLLYDHMPSSIPIRFNLSGNAVAWAEKSPNTLIIILLTQVFLTLVIMGAYYMIGRSRPLIDPANREKTLEQNIKNRYRWSAFLVFSGALLLVSISTIQLSMLGLIPTLVSTCLTIVSPFLVIIMVVVMSVINGQSGNRIRVKAGEQNTPIVRDDDSYWKMGMFYYNPTDPALFIEKRMGIGWTMNWGRPMSWALLIGFAIIIVVYSIINSSLAK